MNAIFIDAGTTWTKILKINDADRSYSVISTSELSKLNLECDKCTGHSLNKVKGDYENEVVALAYGARQYLEDDFTVLDLGSRDAKYVKYKNKKFSDMDWNSTCASATGATIEMLLKFYNIDIKELTYTKDRYSITCGIFGLEKIMDDIAMGVEPSVAISKFIHGIAFNAYNFAKTPAKICLSGGFCENKCFVESLSQYCDVQPLGRFVLVDGLSCM